MVLWDCTLQGEGEGTQPTGFLDLKAFESVDVCRVACPLYREI